MLNSKRSLFASFFPSQDSFLHPSTLSLLGDPQPMVGVAGVEPATLRLSSACSNQLSYTPLFRGAHGIVEMPLVLWWRHGDSNPRPIACKATALPTELCPQKAGCVRIFFPLPDASGI